MRGAEGGSAYGVIPSPFASLRLTLAVALVLAAACSAASRTQPLLQLTAAASGPDTRLTLHPGPHLKVNARAAPALELSNGGVVRFQTGRRTADSAYFAEPPSAVFPGRQGQVHGTLRASVCRDDELVCRSVVVEL